MFLQISSVEFGSEFFVFEGDLLLNMFLLFFVVAVLLVLFFMFWLRCWFLIVFNCIWFKSCTILYLIFFAGKVARYGHDILEF